MARIRSVHPSLWTDEAFVQMATHTRLFLIGLWGESDDYGVFEWKPVTLKMRLAPADNVDATEMLAEAEAAGFIKRFDPSGAFGAVRDFCVYQAPQRPKQVHPLPDDMKPWVAFQDHLARARRRAAGRPSTSATMRRRVFARDGQICRYCGATTGPFEIDHVVPWSRGGAHEFGNLAAACRSCNQAKGDRTPEEMGWPHG